MCVCFYSSLSLSLSRSLSLYIYIYIYIFREDKLKLDRRLVGWRGSLLVSLGLTWARFDRAHLDWLVPLGITNTCAGTGVLGLTWNRLGSLWLIGDHWSLWQLIGTHWHSLEPTGTHHDSLDLTRPHLTHSCLLRFTCFQLKALDFNWCHIASPEFIQLYLTSVSRTWSHLIAIDITCLHLV